jgi:hypothetical protein
MDNCDDCGSNLNYAAMSTQLPLEPTCGGCICGCISVPLLFIFIHVALGLLFGGLFS